jgi:hypothetical protein
MFLFELSTFWLAVVLILTVGGCMIIGILVGRRLHARPEAKVEPVGVVQGTLLGLVGLLLAFGLSMAVSRYETRRTLVVQEANAIGTTYLRAQLLAEPARTASLELLADYADVAVDLGTQVPFTDRFEADAREFGQLQRDLWAEAGEAVAADPTGTAPRVYVESLNEMIDLHTDRMASLRNQVPTAVMLLQIGAVAIGLGVLALYLSMLGRSLATPLIAAAVLLVILFVSFDLDRPERGFITVPAKPLVEARAEMDLPPAAVP